MMLTFFKSSIRTKLIISFTVILLIPSLTIGWTSYTTSKEKVAEQMTLSASETVKLLSSNLDRFIEPEMQNIDYLAEKITGSTYNKQDILRTDTLNPFVSKHPEISTMFVGSTGGVFINSPQSKMPNGYDPRERPWYTAAMRDKGKVIITSPYVSKTTGDFVVGIAKVIKDGSGVLGCEVKLETLSEITKQVSIGKEGYPFILDKESKAIVHPTIKPSEEVKTDWSGKMFEAGSGKFDYNDGDEPKKLVFQTNEITGWKLGGTMFANEVEKEAEPIFNKTILVLGIALFLGGLLVYFITISITRPLKRLVYISEKTGQGDLTEKVDIHSKDELGQLGASFSKMSESLRSLLLEVRQSADQLSDSSAELRESADQTGQASEQIASTILNMAEGTDKQVENANKGSELVNELSDGIQQVAVSAQNVSVSAQHTLTRASGGERTIQESVKQMNSISHSVNASATSVKELGKYSGEIGKIVEVITAIAAQTNLLALNAAIEAARAGENGKGFAIVADEVRKLAEQSADSAKQIGVLVASIQKETGNAIQSMEITTKEVTEGIGVVHTAGESFHEIQHSISGVAEQVEQVSAAVQQMAAGTEQVVGSIETIANIAKEAAFGTQNVSAATEEQLASMEEIGASASSLSHMAEELQALISRFKI
ncbi:HAMP domain-containing protein [Peribacillus cavernae]|uniref:HAMP domain-containing protein n=1 Tax=Peribacillus cavernae TaxID=1674310 RepID=A0A3S0VH71_9BACI|nr:methyl-accepting chemotaxis protein [Peribacillus cavernae]MDQ0220294.1 methyl-accepting chemotaxis protein [Peribacillus cavernae]RUQ31953.1 HAMP domain-containing protein [Peribacillus cavernae]